MENFQFVYVNNYENDQSEFPPKIGGIFNKKSTKMESKIYIKF